MKGPFKQFAFFLIFILFSSNVNSQTDPCTSKLDLKTNIAFPTTSLLCNSVWSTYGFVLRYVQGEPTVWNFVLTTPVRNTYVAIGFSPNGRMVGSSAIVGWVGADSIANIKRYFLGGQTSSAVVPDQGNIQVVNATILVENSQMHLIFQLVNISRPQSRLIYALGPNDILPGSNNRLTQHQDMIATSLNYETGTSATEKDPDAKLKRSHGILNMLGWGILMPIGAMVARYLRNHDPLWFYSHIAVQTTGFSLGIAGIICGFVLNNRIDNNVDRHKGIGITVLAFGCMQVMAILARPDKESKVRKYWNWYHYIIGRALIFLAAVNVFYGIHLADAGTGWNAGYAVVLVVLFITGAGLELRMWMKH